MTVYTTRDRGQRRLPCQLRAPNDEAPVSGVGTEETVTFGEWWHWIDSSRSRISERSAAPHGFKRLASQAL